MSWNLPLIYDKHMYTYFVNKESYVGYSNKQKEKFFFKGKPNWLDYKFTS